MFIFAYCQHVVRIHFAVLLSINQFSTMNYGDWVVNRVNYGWVGWVLNRMNYDDWVVNRMYKVQLDSMDCKISANCFHTWLVVDVLDMNMYVCDQRPHVHEYRDRQSVANRHFRLKPPQHFRPKRHRQHSLHQTEISHRYRIRRRGPECWKLVPNHVTNQQNVRYHLS